MVLKLKLLGVPYELILSEHEFKKEIEDEGLDPENFSAWINHYKRKIFVSTSGNSYDLLFRIIHELVHAIGYINGYKELRTWTKLGEALTDSITHVLTSIFLNIDFIKDITAVLKGQKSVSGSYSLTLLGVKTEFNEEENEETGFKAAINVLKKIIEEILIMRGENPNKTLLKPYPWAIALASILENDELRDYMLELAESATTSLSLKTS